MNRRSFLRGLFGAAVAQAVPKSYFFAPIGGWKSDLILNPNDYYSIKWPIQTIFRDYDEALRISWAPYGNPQFLTHPLGPKDFPYKDHRA